jgi:uncharacterized protein YgiM (DUF1202 family)
MYQVAPSNLNGKSGKLQIQNVKERKKLKQDNPVNLSQKENISQFQLTVYAGPNKGFIFIGLSGGSERPPSTLSPGL